MKKTLLMFFVVLLSVTSLVAGEKMIEPFEVELDSTTTGFNGAPLNYEKADNAQDDSCYAHLTWVDNPVYQGDKALRIDYRIEDSEGWGGYHKLSFSKEDSSACYDFTGYDTLSFMYYIETPISSGNLSFRLNLTDCAESEDGNLADSNSDCEYYYSLNDNILNTTTEQGVWIEQKIALIENGSWDGSAFNLTGWAGASTGNSVIDKDKIKSIDVEFSIADGQAVTKHGVILIDNLVLKGQAKVDYVLFNGVATPGDVTLEGPWSGSAEITDEDDAGDGSTNSIKWVAGDQWAGPGFVFSSPKDMGMNWSVDTLQFKVKGEAGTGTIKVEFGDTDEDGDGTEDWPFTAGLEIAPEVIGWDGTWKQVKIALADIDRMGGWWQADFTNPMDSTKVAKMSIISAVADNNGKTIFLDDIWIGNPVFDWIPPGQVIGVNATAFSTETSSFNLVTWQDVSGESSEVYNVYASAVDFSDLTDPTVELIESGILEGTQTAMHYTKYPLVDGEVDNFYAVTCVDAAGNEGLPAFSGKMTTTAKGCPTISLNPPANFAADGYVDEWYDSGIKPWVLKPETDHIGLGSDVMTDSTDLKATVWMAIDQDYLYIAADVIDDVYYHSESNSWWCNDALDFFIGLYHQDSAPHTSYLSEDQPDHKMQFKADGFMDEITSGLEYESGSENYYFEGFDPDYVFEAKISLDDITSEGEKRFRPSNGMKIPIDFFFHDNDEKSADHESGLAWSTKNNDNGWQSPSNWTYTFIGDQYGYVAIDDEEDNENIITEFKLDQNYPNPFNPTTNITYSLPTSGNVNLTVYNMLGQTVSTLVNKVQNVGTYSVTWDATDMPSGIYFYHIQSNNFTATKKMLLVK